MCNWKNGVLLDDFSIWFCCQRRCSVGNSSVILDSARRWNGGHERCIVPKVLGSEVVHLSSSVFLFFFIIILPIYLFLFFLLFLFVIFIYCFGHQRWVDMFSRCAPMIHSSTGRAATSLLIGVSLFAIDRFSPFFPIKSAALFSPSTNFFFFFL